MLQDYRFCSSHDAPLETGKPLAMTLASGVAGKGVVNFVVSEIVSGWPKYMDKK
jgi:hypothetical protein